MNNGEAASLSDQEAIRAQKLVELRKNGFQFPNDFKPTATSQDIIAAANKEDSGTYAIAGRIVAMRKMGKASFFHLLDEKGKVQIYIKADEVGGSIYEEFASYDLGDIVGVTGYPFITKMGEPSLHAKTIKLLTKSLQPLPEKWHGLSDVETRYRHRYLDLISNPETREVFKKRAQIVSSIRSFLDAKNFIEVETPVLQAMASGAEAKPFKTFYNALSEEMVLRIATELPLKKIVVGGLERVYEIGRIFRNEGLSKKHNPEFTSIEFYCAYATFHDLMVLTEEMLTSIAVKICGSETISYGDLIINFKAPWPRLTMEESIYDVGGVPKDQNLRDITTLRAIVSKLGLTDSTDTNDWGRMLEVVFGEIVEPKLINPTFITHHPFSISPLARRTDGDELVVDRFELFIAGMEAANGFSELNDAEDQQQRFIDQASKKDSAERGADQIDRDFVQALRVGLPPTAGEGIGIDRLTMLLTGAPTIRDVIMFPQLRRE